MAGAQTPHRQAGFTLVEVMVAILLLSVGVLAVVGVVDGANQTTNSTLRREAATNLAREITDAARSIPYDQLTSQSIVSQLQQQPDLGNYGGGPNWTIQRRGVIYTVSASVCSLDDPADGTGSHASGIFCSDSAQPGINNPKTGHPDPQPDDEKRVTVDVQWSDPRGGTKHVKLATLIVNPGNPGGPAVSSLSATPATPLSSATTPITFSVTTSIPAVSVSWSLDGGFQGYATQVGSSGTSWTFTWDVSSVLDGPYTVSAKGYDGNGVSAGSSSLTYTLARQKPQTPSGFLGGWNGAAVDFQWLANPDKDITAYSVTRVSDNAAVCQTTTQLSCQDTSPPANASSIQYVLTATDAEGSTSTQPITVTQGNQPPNAPTNLSAISNGSSTTLTWTAPSPADADGDAISFYRIYRDGTAFADRYSTADSTTFTDSNTGGVAHTYYVSAVDPQLAESSLLGPVTK